MSGLLIVGASGHGKVVVEAASAMGRWNDIAFADDRFVELGTWHGHPVVSSSSPDSSLLERFSDVIVAIGKATTRLRLLSAFEAAGFIPATVIHPAATVSASATIGPGSVLLGGAVVNASASLGRGCIINTGASVDHDCMVGEGVHICPGAALAGDVTVGARSWISIGSSVIQGVNIADDVTVGAGGAVINDIGAGVTAVGVPARPLTRRSGP